MAQEALTAHAQSYSSTMGRLAQSPQQVAQIKADIERLREQLVESMRLNER